MRWPCSTASRIARRPNSTGPGRARSWPSGWHAAIDQLAAGRCTLLGLWGDAGAACTWRCSTRRSRDIAVADATPARTGHIQASARGIRRRFGSNARSAICSAWKPIGAPDTRPWLDLGFWDVASSARQTHGPRRRREPYAFLPAEGEGLHQIPVGPVHAGIIEPGHFRFTANGEHVVRLEQRLGYVHKGIESLMAGATLERAAQTRRPHLRRQHGRLCLCLRAGRRSRAAGQARRRAPSICAR